MRLSESSPTLIVGMHRSGTSLLTELLQAQGFFVGWRLDSHHESTFFQRLNRRLTAEAGGQWSRPDVVATALESSDPQVLAKPLLSYLDGPLAIEYWGRRFRTRHDDPTPWGWKDPRNGYLLGLWRAIYPDLRVIWIRRDPRETAESLYRRAQQIRSTIESNAASTAGRATLRRASASYRGHPILADSWNALRPEGCLEIALAYERVHHRLLRPDEPGVHVVDYAEMVADPPTVVSTCADFVGLAPRAPAAEPSVNIREPSLDYATPAWQAIERAALEHRSELRSFGYT